MANVNTAIKQPGYEDEDIEKVMWRQVELLRNLAPRRGESKLPKIASLQVREAVIPAFYLKFYTLSVGTTTVFATLLVEHVFFGVHTIHPFLSLIGILGGLSWLVPAACDMKDWKRGKASA